MAVMNKKTNSKHRIMIAEKSPIEVKRLLNLISGLRFFVLALTVTLGLLYAIFVVFNILALSYRGISIVVWTLILINIVTWAIIGAIKRKLKRG